MATTLEIRDWAQTLLADAQTQQVQGQMPNMTAARIQLLTDLLELIGTPVDSNNQWRDAFAGYVHNDELRHLLVNGSAQEFVIAFMREVQKIDWHWREEIAKYLPQINFTSFSGPQSTIRWLMERVTISSTDKAIADRIKEMEPGDL